MLGKKAKLRIYLFIVIFSFLAIFIFLIFRSLEKNIVYFLSPSEIYRETNISFDKKVSCEDMNTQTLLQGIKNYHEKV